MRPANASKRKDSAEMKAWLATGCNVMRCGEVEKNVTELDFFFVVLFTVWRLLTQLEGRERDMMQNTRIIENASPTHRRQDETSTHPPTHPYTRLEGGPRNSLFVPSKFSAVGLWPSLSGTAVREGIRRSAPPAVPSGMTLRSASDISAPVAHGWNFFFVKMRTRKESYIVTQL